MARLTIAIAAPTPMLRAGLRAMLTTDVLQVVAEAASPAALAAAPPEVDVLVVTGPGLLEDTLRLAVGDRAPAVVALADDDPPVAILRALPLRGWGIVPEDAPAADLQAAVLAAAQGLVVLAHPLARRLLAPAPAAQPLAGGPPDETLTAREREVLELLSQGLSNKGIARKLQISEHTVKFHVSSIYGKLGVTSRTEAVSRGARAGLITL